MRPWGARCLLACALVCCAIFWGGGPARALEPPRPGELARLEREGKLDDAVARAKALGNDRLAPALMKRVDDLLTLGGAATTLPVWPRYTGLETTGVQAAPTVLIDFSDYPATVTPGQLDSLLNGPGDPARYPVEDLHDYYARASYGALDLRCDVLGVYHAGVPRGDIDVNDWSSETRLIEQAFASFDATQDFSQYDHDGDGVIDYAVVYWTGPAGDWASFWWGHFGGGGGTVSFDGVTLGPHSWQWEPTGMDASVVIHETGHALGLPDYYDYDDTVGPRGGVGGWDPMSVNQGDHNAFSKMMLGWLTPQVVPSGSSTLTLRPSSRYPDAAIVMPQYSLAAPEREFFIVQTRDASSNDAIWPYQGMSTKLQIWHVDALTTPYGWWQFDNSYTEHKLLRLMEADGREDIENGWGSDAEDLDAPGMSFGPATTPSSAPYRGTASGVSVDEITQSGESLLCTLTAGPNDLDLTAPVTSLAGGAGWHNEDVSLDFLTTEPGTGTWTFFRFAGWESWLIYDAASPWLIDYDTGKLLTVEAYSQDESGNLETPVQFKVGVDTLPPGASRTGPAGLWHNTATSSVIDGWDDGGSGVKRIGYRETGQAWTYVAGGRATIRIPAAGNDGRHDYEYHSYDMAGNESADGTFVVRIDTKGPTTWARYAYGRRYHPIALRYKITDAQSPKAKAVQLIVRNSRGTVVKRIFPPIRATGTWYTASWTPRARGVYRYLVRAKDLAGNSQAVTGSARITVR